MQWNQGIESILLILEVELSPAKKDANSVQKKIQVKDWLYLHWLQVWPPNVSEWVGQWLIDSDFGNSDDDNHNACTM